MAPDAQSPWNKLRYEVRTSFDLAWDSIRAHKLRSFLTLLGVIIGVASVVLVGSGIEGLGLYAEESTAKAFGTDSYFIAQVASAGRLTRKQFMEKLRRNKRIRGEDAQYLSDTTGDSVIYSPYRQRGNDVKCRDVTLEDVGIVGVWPTLPEIRDVTLVEGRFINEMDEQGRQPVAVIGEDIRTGCFSGVPPLGGVIKINGIDFRVIGIQEKLGSVFGRSQDLSAYIPYSTFQRMFGPATSIGLFGKARPGSGIAMSEAIDITRAALRVRYKTPPAQEDNFDILTPDAIRGFVDSLMALISAVVIPVTGISLVVGGIVIMNIMLVSVTERTREIGIRKSLGARISDIRLQFLLEAVILSCFGGLIGLALGVGLSEGLSRAFGLSMRVTPGYVMLAIFVSSTVGIISGWYPASRAAKLDPIVALRQE
jgi:putative ABC transport system permease protein